MSTPFSKNLAVLVSSQKHRSSPSKVWLGWKIIHPLQSCELQVVFFGEALFAKSFQFFHSLPSLPSSCCTCTGLVWSSRSEPITGAQSLSGGCDGVLENDRCAMKKISGQNDQPVDCHSSIPEVERIWKWWFESGSIFRFHVCEWNHVPVGPEPGTIPHT